MRQFSLFANSPPRKPELESAPPPALIPSSEAFITCVPPATVTFWDSYPS